MKKLLTILIMGSSTFGFVSAHASFPGTPEQDAIVKDLRDRFASGRTPTQSELADNTWTCKEMVAGKNDFRKLNYSVKLAFQKFDGYLQVVMKNTILDSVLLANNGSEFVGNFSEYAEGRVNTSAFRMDSNGFLINEYSYDISQSSLALEPIAKSAPGSRVASYSLCIKN